MKNKIWLIQLPIIALFTFAFYIHEAGVNGNLHSKFLRNTLWPALRTYSTFFTDRKFKFRGEEKPKSKIVVVEIDSAAIEKLGRWPWHRDITGLLIDSVFKAGAKVVGLDMVFSEPDQRIPDELGEILKAQNLGDLVQAFETDHHLERFIAEYRDRLVLGWTTESSCQPAFSEPDECPVAHPDAIASHPAGFEKFAYSVVNKTPAFDPATTPLASLVTFIANTPMFSDVAAHSGYFNAFQDPDGYIRRTSLFLVANGNFYPSLSLEMARIGLGEDLQVSLDSEGRVGSLGFVKSGRTIAVSPLGAMEINFRGPGKTFTYVPALEVLGESDAIEVEVDRRLATVSKADLLRDAYVLIGISALGVFDMRAFPFDSNVPGVEGHANILDNLLSSDPLLYGGGATGKWIIYLLMTVGALVFGFLTQRLESIPALLLFITAMAGMGFADQKLLFENNFNWTTAFLYAEIGTIFILTLAVKYVIEERSKKFVKGAFAKYVSPAVVDSILKDPAKLTVGGEKKELTIMFSDIRSFTTFSEKMDAKALSNFLNDYLGMMTEIVFKHEGTLDKYIGDAIMAFWGAPLDQPKHATNALKATIEMMQVLQANKERWLKDFAVDVNVGAGVNSGAVSVGNMGAKNNFSYTVIGDHVNLASRVEGLTKYYHSEILTTRFTFDMIQKINEAFPPHRTLDFVKVKGKKTAVEMIQVLPFDLDKGGLQMFEEARILYTKQRWDEAIKLFSEAGKILSRAPGSLDGPSEMYIERCNDFKAAPPSEDWDGTWEMTSK